MTASWPGSTLQPDQISKLLLQEVGVSHFKRVLLMTWLMSAAGVVTAAAAQTAGEQTMATQTDDGGFDDWGLLGLLGLAGLLGRKRDRDVETRRV
ncbi:MAG TPA: WGxxGxxG family protein [Gemmatimonadales bacterium]|nr:WGxxGxxG family protein [Gemmatimonadales bacterium]